MISKIKPVNLNLPNFSAVVYGYGMELPAYTLARGMIALSGKPVNLLGLYDFLLLDLPYSEESPILLVNGEMELKEIENVVRPLGVKGLLITCNDKSESQLKTVFLKGDMCEVNLSFSLVSWLTKNFSSPRTKRLTEELDLTDLGSWLGEIMKEIEPSLDFVLSPVLLPALNLMRENQGNKIKGFYEKDFSDSNVIYTGVDSMMGRRTAHQIRAMGKIAKEVVINTDPLTAPIYLSIMSYIFKNRTQGS
ncbi:hypothetical protein DFR87_03195 [Metallosphaera hakonensis JCM 8857 = DSM 7519]|uniref:Uncharacterized protein n=1 Tax=Metallosphaera hakonensis JCM 8857 = DSM 7519 TaxID=1293036 RepID=A0A2U9ISE0_9CREN|nr:hypothetical protein DFR87_03195 [Metallosphaera hakonensis JCM 8857 = DSM 7519]